MKKNVILVWMLFSVFNIYESHAQIVCTAIEDPQESQQLAIQLAAQGTCTDNFSEFDLTQDITYNLMLRYAKDGTGYGEVSQTQRTDIEMDINNVYNNKNIHFNFIWVNLDCDECTLDYSNWPPRIEDSNVCIQGDVLGFGPPTPNGSTGFSGVNSGTFWALQQTVPHELGHALGLYHTFRQYEAEPSTSNELITRTLTGIDPCSCNCLSTGDMICDTDADPYVQPNNLSGQELIDALDHNSDMFDFVAGSNFTQCELNNDGGILDGCGTLYSGPVPELMNNVMSYHCNDQSGASRLTDGQSLMIRRRTSNGDGSFRYQTDPNEMPFAQGLSINVPTTKNTDEAFNGDITVNADLTIENCTIELTEGHRIIVNAGASLTLKNATIRTYTGGICYFPMPDKKHWEGIEIVPSASSLTSISVFNNTTIDVSEAGMYNIDTPDGLLNLTFNNSTMNGPAITLTKTKGIQKLLKSNFSHTVSVTDNFYLQVSGCSFDLTEHDQASGIKAANTYLMVEDSHDGVRSTFKNCGLGIEFISSSAHWCKISSSDFDQVLTGINAESMAGFFSAHDCTITMRDPSGTQGFGQGIYLDNFIDFEIYDNNDIIGMPGTGDIGIYLGHMGLNDNPNLIINNTIENCSKGIYSTSAELGNTMSGVEFECNTMENIQYDNFHTDKIGPHQGRDGTDGSDARPAGNKFDGSTIGFQDFNYEGGGWTDVKTYHYRNLGLENIVNYNDGSQNTGIPVFTTNELVGGELPQCTYPPVPNAPNPLPQVSTTRSDSLDGGDTDVSISIIHNDSDSDPVTVITHITDDSPWVSVPVVQTLFEYSPYYTEQEIVNVIIQNPGVLADNYISEIAFESGSFSTANQQAMILAYQSGDSRIDYESSLVDHILEGTLHIKNTLHTEMDNGTFDQSVIRTALADKISYTKQYQIVESYLMEQDYQGATLALSAKQDFENYDPHLLLEKTTYAEIIQMQSDLNAQGEYWTKLSAANKNRLISIANTYNGVATIKARNILKMYFDMQFGALPVKPTHGPLQFTSATRSSKDGGDLIRIYPNPTYDVLNVELMDEPMGTSFRLLGMNGKMVLMKTLKEIKNRIDLTSLGKGIYFYEITQGGKILSVNKIIILD